MQLRLIHLLHLPLRLNVCKRLIEPVSNLTEAREGFWADVIETRTPSWQRDREVANGLLKADFHTLLEKMRNGERMLVTGVVNSGSKLGTVENGVNKILKERFGGGGGGGSAGDKQNKGTSAGEGDKNIVKYKQSRRFWTLKKSRDPELFF